VWPFRQKHQHSTNEMNSPRGSDRGYRRTPGDFLQLYCQFVCLKCLSIRKHKLPVKGNNIIKNLSCRTISTSRLNTLLRLHLKPINHMFYMGPQMKPNLEGGFVLICFQHLSRPRDSYPAVPLAGQLVHQRRVHSGPLVLGTALLKFRRPRQIGTELSHDVLNPARVPL
jgi:hypothetical protein